MPRRIALQSLRERLAELDQQLYSMNLGKTPDVGVVQLTGELQIILAELAEYDKHYQPGVATGGQQRCSGCGTPLTQEQDFGMGLCRLCDTLEGEE